MEEKKQIKQLMEEILGIKDSISVARMGGLTNKTFLVEIENGKKYVVRLPGEGTEQIINRVDEKISTELACEIGIDTKLYYFDENTGIKITEYIAESETMNMSRLQEEDNIIRVAKILQRLHSSDVDTGVCFDVIDMAETYEKFIIENQGFFYDDYEEVKKYINSIKNRYMPTVVKKPCHNDPLCENWILQNHEKMFLIDWEYAGMNDPIWDLADVSLEAEYDEHMDELLLKTYFDGNVGEKEWNAFQINKVLIDYLWSLWGKTRAVYDGEELEIYARNRYIRMKKTMKNLI